MRPLGDVAGGQQVGITLDGQRRVASDSALDSEPAVGKPVRAGHRAEGNDHHVGLVPRAVSELDATDAADLAVESRDADAEAQVDSMRAMQRGAALAEERAKRGHRGGGDVEERDLEPQLLGPTRPPRSR